MICNNCGLPIEGNHLVDLGGGYLHPRKTGPLFSCEAARASAPPTTPDPVGEAVLRLAELFKENERTIAALRAENERLNCAYNSMLRAHDAHALEADRYRTALVQAREACGPHGESCAICGHIDAVLGEK